MKRFIDEVADAQQVEAGASEQKKLKNEDGNVDPASVQTDNVEQSLPRREGGGGRYRDGGGRGRGRGSGTRRTSFGGRGEGNSQSQDPSLNALLSGEVIIKTVINLKKEMAGAVIGKGGGKVTRMREETGAQIHVCPPARRNDTERAVEVTGAIEKVQKAENQIYELMLETDKAWCEEESTGVRIEIHILPEMVGCLIGRQGSRVKAIREELDVTVHVDTKKEVVDNQMVSVSGTAAKAHEAHVRIMEHLKEFDPTKSKLLLKRVQSQRNRTDTKDGIGGGMSAAAGGPMVVLQGSQLPQLSSTPQVLIQQPDGTYTVAQVQIQGMMGAGGLGGGLGASVMQPQQTLQMQTAQLGGGFGQGVDTNSYLQQGMQLSTAGMFGQGLDAVQNGQLAMQLGQQPNPNAQQFGN
eukprot:TRINITY_DN413_c0_g1_i4.p1 TRINITY_DN413_c0_g1~~TRINITY_DN413_c0_g1_i4.p1  ORF type:complete len:409 (+),score=84.06 TRINITY_DN413_c0_g1_i4:129-1355(+)